MLTFREYLTEEDTRINPTSFDLTALYRQFNSQLFGGKLETIPVKWGKTPKGALGVTMAKVMRQPGMPAFMKKTIPGSIEIIMEPHPYPLSQLHGIFAHEMCHAENFMLNQHDRDSHGGYFMAAVGRAQRNASFKIPLKDDKYERSDDEVEQAKSVMFLAAETKEGKRIVTLYSVNLNPKDTSMLPLLAAKSTDSKYWKWAMVGIATTTLADRMSVQRKFNGYKTLFTKLPDSREFKVTRVTFTAGDVPVF